MPAVRPQQHARSTTAYPARVPDLGVAPRSGASRSSTRVNRAFAPNRSRRLACAATRCRLVDNDAGPCHCRQQRRAVLPRARAAKEKRSAVLKPIQQPFRIGPEVSSPPPEAHPLDPFLPAPGGFYVSAAAGRA